MKLQKIETLEQLLKINYQDIQPFSLTIQGKELFVEKVLRIIPGRRIVVSGVWQEQKVVAKLFIDPKRAKRNALLEKEGYQNLQRFNVETPALNVIVEMDIAGTFVAIYSEIYPAKMLSEQLAKTSPKKNIAWLNAVQKVIAKLHAHDLVQADIHLDNFLLNGDDVYLLDCATIASVENEGDKLSNLALFYAQLPLKFSDKLDDMFLQYCTLRGISVEDQFDRKVLPDINRFRVKRANGLMKKCLRNSTQFAAENTANRAYACQRKYDSKDMQLFFQNPEAYISSQNAEIIKNGNTATLFKLELDGKTVIVKRYNVKSAMHFLTHAWQTSRAKNSWVYANLLRLFNVNTPEPIAYLEKHVAGLNRTTYFVMEYLPGKNLFDYCMHVLEPNILSKTVALINSLKLLSLSHGDFKATNFFVSDDGIHLIDLDGMRLEDQKNFPRAHQKDIERFRKNWLKNPKLLKEFDTELL